MQSLDLKSNAGDASHIDALRASASELEAIVREMERAAVEHVSATPSTPVVMSSDCNPLHDLSAVADFALPFRSVGASQD